MGIQAKNTAVLRWPQQQALLPGSTYDVFRDDCNGLVDYDRRINPSPIPAWPEGEGKLGFGLGPFGMDPFGLEGINGLGFGQGAFGLGFFGFEVVPVDHYVTPLRDGLWRFGVLAVDPAGNVSESVEDEAAIVGAPEPPAKIAAADYALVGDRLTLDVGLSADDEGP
jgi:hypothetical protein